MPRAVCGGAPPAGQGWLALSPSPHHHLRVTQPPQAPGCSRAGGCVRLGTSTPVSPCPGPFFWAPTSRAHRLTRERPLSNPLNTKRWEAEEERGRGGERDIHTLRAHVPDAVEVDGGSGGWECGGQRKEGRREGAGGGKITAPDPRSSLRGAATGRPKEV